MSQSLILLSLASICAFLYAAFLWQFPNYWKEGLLLYILTVFVISYCYQPAFGLDLYRYFQDLTSVQGMSLVSASQYFEEKYTDNLYIRDFVFWLISNYFSFHVLPAISTSTVYGIGCYLIGDYAVRTEQTRLIGPLFLLMFLQLPFFGILVNLRNIWAFSLFILAAYRDLIQHKRNLLTLILYIFPYFLHSAVLMLILIRLLVPLARRITYLMPLFIFFLPGVVNLLNNHLSSVPSFLIPIIQKASGYISSEGATEWTAQVASSTFFLIQKIAMVTVAICMIILIFRNKDVFRKTSLSFLYFNLLIFVMVIACTIFPQPHYWRFYCAGILSLNVLTVSLFSKFSSLNNLSRFLLTFYSFSSVFMYVINFWNSLRSY